MAKFAPYQQATGCKSYGPRGAAALIAWAQLDFGRGAQNWGVCNCRSVRGAHVPSTHGECRAADIGFKLINGKANPAGSALVMLLAAHAERLGIQCIIWNRTLWSAQHPNGTPYKGEAPHYDHIHVELTRAAGQNLNLATIRAVIRILAPSQPVPAPSQPAPAPTPSPQPAVDLRAIAAAIDAASKHTFRRGDNSPHIKWAQALLNNKLDGQDLVIDGDFGLQTENHVKWFQTNIQKFFKISPAEFPADGVIGPKTWFWLRG